MGCLFDIILYSFCPKQVMQDYCEKDVFEAECPAGKIIVIEEARYGRMELGTCLVTDIGYLNCYR